MTEQTTRYKAGPYYRRPMPHGGWEISPWSGEIEVSADETQWRHVIVSAGRIATPVAWTLFRRGSEGLSLAELTRRGFWVRVEPDIPEDMKVSEGL